MVTIAVIDDRKSDRDSLCALVSRYQEESHADIALHVYSSPLDLLEEDKKEDIYLLDIEMPGTSGIEAAKEIRRKDARAPLIFVTNLAQYAIQGYEVGAMDYCLKPVQYAAIARILSRAIPAAQKNQKETVHITSTQGEIVLPMEEIIFVDKDKNYLVFHTRQKDYLVRGSMQDALTALSGHHFSMVSSGCLCNLAAISRIEKDTVIAGNYRIPVSRRKYQAFTQDFMEFVSEG